MENSEEKKSDQIVLHFFIKECKENCEYSIELKAKHDNSISFETETIECDSNNSNIKFSETLLCNYYFYKPQNIEVNIKRTKDGTYYVKYQLKPEYGLTLSTIVNSKNSSFQYPINKNNENSEKIMIVAEKSDNANPNKYTLFDYLKAGISFDSYIVIDFSEKIEHTHAYEINQYINSIGGIRIALKDFLKTFKVYGYGGNPKIPGQNKNNSSFFNLNLNGKEDLKGLTEIRNAYEHCIDNLDFCNNRVLSPLIKNILRAIYKKYQLTKYNILFLLMNNAPKKEDYQKCIDALIESSLQPLSIVIIGIGDKENEFKNIKNLSNNNRCHSTGMQRTRNNIFFFSMKECNNDANLLKNICLKEIPKQMVEFYNLINITPNDIRNDNLKNIEQSLIKSVNILDPGSLCENIDSAPSILACSKNLKNENNELDILESNFLIDQNLEKETDRGDENFKIGKIELEKIDNGDDNDNNMNINEIKSIEEDNNNSFNPKKTIIKKNKNHDKEKCINNMENINEKYTNTPLGKNESNNKENPYASKFINTPIGSGEINQKNFNKNPFKCSSISDKNTLNSIKKSSKESILVYNLNSSENNVNSINNIKDSQKPKPFSNYSIDDF